MRGPMPAPARSPLRLRRCGGGLRGSRPGCGLRLPGPGLAFGGPGCGSLAPGRCAALALAVGAGSPPVGAAAAAPRGPALRRGRVRVPAALARRAQRPPLPRSLAGPCAALRASCGRPWPAPCPAAARSVPPRVPPALPRPAGRGAVGPAPPPARGRLGRLGRPGFSRRPRAGGHTRAFCRKRA